MGRRALGLLALAAAICSGHLRRYGLDAYVLRLAVDCVELAQVLEDTEAVLLAVEAAEPVSADLGLVLGGQSAPCPSRRRCRAGSGCCADHLQRRLVCSELGTPMIIAHVNAAAYRVSHTLRHDDC